MNDVDTFKELTQHYKNQQAIADAINHKSGANIDRSTISRIESGKASANTIKLCIFVINQIVIDSDPEYQMSLI